MNGAQDEDEDEESGSEASGPRGPGPEVGPRPLAPLSEDRADPELAPGFPACFALRSATSVGPSAVVARSLLWPGAFTLAVGRLVTWTHRSLAERDGKQEAGATIYIILWIKFF